MQIIVTSWSRAGLPVSRLRIRDELVEIGCESLCFNRSEARSFLNDVGGLQLSGSDVDALTASTDGWAAALQLAALSLRSGGDASSLIGRLSGASDVVGEFLAENVVDTLEPELREFLLAAQAVGAFRTQVTRHWLKTLRRRSQRTTITWAWTNRLAIRWLPKVRIMHPYPDVRFDAKTQGRSPVR